MSKSNLIVIGAVPPPIGGVTIHVLRLVSGLKSLGYDFEFIDFRMRNKNNKIDLKRYIVNVIRVMNSRNTNVIHYQLNNLLELTLLVIISVFIKSRIITTVHSFRPEVMNGTNRFLFGCLTKTRIEFIAPSETTKGTLISKGVKAENIKVINTFLPPSKSEINDTLPFEVMEFINSKKNIVVANAYKLYRDNLGTDVYGLDMCIEACRKIPESNFIFCVPIISDFEYFDECKNRIKEYGIADRFFIVNKDISLVSLFKYVDLFVRPTSTDSFGVSVAEALAMGVPAIASDVCVRAEGTITFQSRNQNEFNQLIRELLKEEINLRSGVNMVYIIQKYVELYQSKNGKS